LGGEIGGILEAPTRLLDAYYLYTAGLLIIYNTYNYQYERSVVCAWHDEVLYGDRAYERRVHFYQKITWGGGAKVNIETEILSSYIFLFVTANKKVC